MPGIKEPGQLSFPDEVHRDGPGWTATVNLPQGVEVVEVLERCGRLSSALRLPVDQVWPEPGPDHAGQLVLWVGRQPTSNFLPGGEGSDLSHRTTTAHYTLALAWQRHGMRHDR